MYAVVLAGGGGTRLWPLSRPEVPKPFLPLLGPHSLLADTVRRLLDGHELPLGPSDVTIVADGRYEPLIRADVPHVNYLREPAARNTAAAIALAVACIDRPEDEVMLVLPADHAIARPGEFRACLARAAEVAGGRGRFRRRLPLVTLGIRPNRPATEYGYLIPAGPTRAGVARLAGFEEKPTAGRAEELLSIPGVAWNAGIFVWRREAIADALGRWAPDVWSAVQPWPGGRPYADLPATSIDYAVMEAAAAAGLVATVHADVGWSDIGTWTALLAALDVPSRSEVVAAGASVGIEADDLLVRRTRGTLVLEGGPAAFHGLPGPVAVLRGAASARHTVQALLDRVTHAATSTSASIGHDTRWDMLTFAPVGRRVDKPWGFEVIWAETDRYAGKLLVIEAGAQLSLQLHDQKDESILVLSGELGLLLEDESGDLRVLELHAGETARVPARRRHRFMARTRTELIEVSSPELDDVVRLADDYGRTGTSAP